MVQASSLQSSNWQAGCLPHFPPSCITYAEGYKNNGTYYFHTKKEGNPNNGADAGSVNDTGIKDVEVK